MEQRENQGYIITDSIHIGEVEFVVGESPKAPSPFVTWQCKDGDSYFWGHYFSESLAAKHDLLVRAGREIKYQQRAHESTSKKSREMERER